MKFKPVAKGADGKPYTGVDVYGAVSGASSFIKSVTMTAGGKLIESVSSCNRLYAQGVANASLERKVYVNRTEGVSYFVNGKATDNSDARQAFLGKNNRKRYAMHSLNTALKALPVLELPLVSTTGIDLELLLTADLKEPY